jgi:APA family basic amino acid/polyamine antiporter
MGETSTSNPPAEPEQHIGLTGAVMLVVGNVIGAGIFLTSGLMLVYLHTAGELLSLWLAGGLLAFCGGITYGELGSMYPHSGGLYVYLKEAYGARIAFLFGWTNLAIILTGQIAAIAVGFAEYLSYFIPGLSPSNVVVRLSVGERHFWSVSAGQIIAATSIALLAALNIVNLHGSRHAAVYLTAVKIAALVVLIVVCLWTTHGLAAANWRVEPKPSYFTGYALAMIPVLYSYEGWSYLAFAASELRQPSKNLPRALMMGIGIVTLLYVLVNVAFVNALPLEALRGVERVAEAAATAASGRGGATFVTLAALLSTFGGNAALIFVTSRVFFAMSRQGELFRTFGVLHPKRGTPSRSVALVCTWSIILALSGTYEQLYTLVTFAIIIFSIAGGSAVFVLRRTQRSRPRPYRALGYPWLPALFVTAMVALAFNTIIEAPVPSFAGIVLVGVGWPLHALLSSRWNAWSAS